MSYILNRSLLQNISTKQQLKSLKLSYISVKTLIKNILHPLFSTERKLRQLGIG